jgi:hypothetical protein
MSLLSYYSCDLWTGLGNVHEYIVIAFVLQSYAWEMVQDVSKKGNSGLKDRSINTS